MGKWLLGAAVLALLSAPASAAILTNGDFEQPGGVVRDGLTTNYLPGWTYDSHGTGFEIYESSGMDGLNAADGSHYVSFGHSGAYGGEISQTFATTAGVTYVVRYSVAEQQGDDPSQVLRAYVDNGGAIISADNTNLGLTFAQGADLTFVASGASATLHFLDATPAGGGGSSNLALDAVSVTGGGVGVPEPATWAVLLAGFGLAGASLRRRRMAVV